MINRQLVHEPKLVDAHLPKMTESLKKSINNEKSVLALEESGSTTPIKLEIQVDAVPNQKNKCYQLFFTVVKIILLIQLVLLLGWSSKAVWNNRASESALGGRGDIFNVEVNLESSDNVQDEIESIITGKKNFALPVPMPLSAKSKYLKDSDLEDLEEWTSPVDNNNKKKVIFKDNQLKEDNRRGDGEQSEKTSTTSIVPDNNQNESSKPVDESNVEKRKETESQFLDFWSPLLPMSVSIKTKPTKKDAPHVPEKHKSEEDILEGIIASILNGEKNHDSSATVISNPIMDNLESANNHFMKFWNSLLTGNNIDPPKKVPEKIQPNLKNKNNDATSLEGMIASIIAADRPHSVPSAFSMSSSFGNIGEPRMQVLEYWSPIITVSNSEKSKLPKKESRQVVDKQNRELKNIGNLLASIFAADKVPDAPSPISMNADADAQVFGFWNPTPSTNKNEKMAASIEGERQFLGKQRREVENVGNMIASIIATEKNQEMPSALTMMSSESGQNAEAHVPDYLSPMMVLSDNVKMKPNPDSNRQIMRQEEENMPPIIIAVQNDGVPSNIPFIPNIDNFEDVASPLMGFLHPQMLPVNKNERLKPVAKHAQEMLEKQINEVANIGNLIASIMSGEKSGIQSAFSMGSNGANVEHAGSPTRQFINPIPLVSNERTKQFDKESVQAREKQRAEEANLGNVVASIIASEKNLRMPSLSISSSIENVDEAKAPIWNDWSIVLQPDNDGKLLPPVQQKPQILRNSNTFFERLKYTRDGEEEVEDLQVNGKTFISCKDLQNKRHPVPSIDLIYAYGPSYKAHIKCAKYGVTLDDLRSGITRKEYKSESQSPNVDNLFLRCEDIFNQDFEMFTSGLLKDYERCKKAGALSQSAVGDIEERFKIPFQILRDATPGNVDLRSYVSCKKLLPERYGSYDTFPSRVAHETCVERGVPIDLLRKNASRLVWSSKWFVQDDTEKLYISCRDVFNGDLVHVTDQLALDYQQCKQVGAISPEWQDYIEKEFSNSLGKFSDQANANARTFTVTSDIQVGNDAMIQVQNDGNVDFRSFVNCAHLKPMLHSDYLEVPSANTLRKCSEYAVSADELNKGVVRNPEREWIHSKFVDDLYLSCEDAFSDTKIRVTVELGKDFEQCLEADAFSRDLMDAYYKKYHFINIEYPTLHFEIGIEMLAKLEQKLTQMQTN